MNLSLQVVDKHKSNEDLAKNSSMKKSAECCGSESKIETDEVNNEIKNGTDKMTAERTMSDSLNTNASAQRSTKNCTDLKTELEQKWNESKNQNDSKMSESQEEKEKKLESNIALTSLIVKLSEKQMKKVTSNSGPLMTSILDFVTQDLNCDIEILRKAMYCQVRRCNIRKEGLQMTRHLLNENYLLTSVNMKINVILSNLNILYVFL